MSSLDRFRQQSPGSVLVIAIRQIGDVLLTTPLIRSTRLLWPGTAIDVLGFSETLGMIQGNPDIRRLIGAPSHGGAISILRFALAQRLWRAYDLVLVTTHSDRAHLLGFVAARVRSGIVPAASRSLWWKRALLSHRVTLAGDRGDVHVIDEKLALLAPWLEESEHDEEPVHAVGVTNSVACSERAQRDVVAPANSFSAISATGIAAPRFAPSVVAPPLAPLPTEVERALRDRYVVVHVPSMWRYKQWPLESFVELVNALVTAGMQVVLTGGESAADIEKVRQVEQAIDVAQVSVGDVRTDQPKADDHARKTPDAEQHASARGIVINLCGLVDFSQLATLLKRATLYVGPDTSVTHLAAAIGTRTIALFGPTNPVRWGPRGPRGRSSVPGGADASATPSDFQPPWQRVAQIQSCANVLLLQGPGKSVSCVPCGRAGCDDHRESRSVCLESIGADRVIEASMKVLFERS